MNLLVGVEKPALRLLELGAIVDQLVGRLWSVASRESRLWRRSADGGALSGGDDNDGGAGGKLERFDELTILLNGELLLFELFLCKKSVNRNSFLFG